MVWNGAFFIDFILTHFTVNVCKKIIHIACVCMCVSVGFLSLIFILLFKCQVALSSNQILEKCSLLNFHGDCENKWKKLKDKCYVNGE